MRNAKAIYAASAVLMAYSAFFLGRGSVRPVKQVQDTQCMAEISSRESDITRFKKGWLLSQRERFRLEYELKKCQTATPTPKLPAMTQSGTPAGNAQQYIQLDVFEGGQFKLRCAALPSETSACTHQGMVIKWKRVDATNVVNPGDGTPVPVQ